MLDGDAAAAVAIVAAAIMIDICTANLAHLIIVWMLYLLHIMLVVMMKWCVHNIGYCCCWSGDAVTVGFSAAPGAVGSSACMSGSY